MKIFYKKLVTVEQDVEPEDLALELEGYAEQGKWCRSVEEALIKASKVIFGLRAELKFRNSAEEPESVEGLNFYPGAYFKDDLGSIWCCVSRGVHRDNVYSYRCIQVADPMLKILTNRMDTFDRLFYGDGRQVATGFVHDYILVENYKMEWADHADQH